MVIASHLFVVCCAITAAMPPRTEPRGFVHQYIMLVHTRVSALPRLFVVVECSFNILRCTEPRLKSEMLDKGYSINNTIAFDVGEM